MAESDESDGRRTGVGLYRTRVLNSRTLSLRSPMNTAQNYPYRTPQNPQKPAIFQGKKGESPTVRGYRYRTIGLGTDRWALMESDEVDFVGLCRTAGATCCPAMPADAGAVLV